MTEDAIRVTAGRPSSTSRGGGPASKLPAPIELLVLGLVALSILIAAAVDDGFGARSAWLFVTILAASYILSRGLAQHGRDHHDRL